MLQHSMWQITRLVPLPLYVHTTAVVNFDETLYYHSGPKNHYGKLIRCQSLMIPAQISLSVPSISVVVNYLTESTSSSRSTHTNHLNLSVLMTTLSSPTNLRHNVNIATELDYKPRWYVCMCEWDRCSASLVDQTQAHDTLILADVSVTLLLLLLLSQLSVSASCPR